MNFISTKTHGILDYMTGILLIAAPWLFGFANGGAAQWIPVALGIVMLVMAVVTDYEYSLVKAVPMPVHLTMDVLAGLFLAVSPWLFGFADIIAWPHVVVGLFEAGAGLLTSKVPGYKAITR